MWANLVAKHVDVRRQVQVQFDLTRQKQCYKHLAQRNCNPDWSELCIQISSSIAREACYCDEVNYCKFVVLVRSAFAVTTGEKISHAPSTSLHCDYVVDCIKTSITNY